MAKYILMISILVSFSMGATTFIPMSIEQQLRDATGVIRGIYQGSSFKKERNDKVVTEASFKIKTMSGIKNHEVINKNNFKVIYPGGKWHGVTYQISGTPDFKVGEEVILLITKTNTGFFLTNLALGKYTIKKEFGKEYLTSVVFPNNAKLSRIPIDKFNKVVGDVFGSPLADINPDKFVYTEKTDSQGKNAKRSPASIEEDKQEIERQSSMLWLIVLFAFLGFYSSFITKRRHKK